MDTSKSKKKLTLTIEEEVVDKAKKEAEERNTKLSASVQKFLQFFVEPWIYCFKCGKKINVKGAEVCPRCDWLKCPECGVCRCDLSEDTAEVAFYMRKIYEELLGGRLKF